MFYINIDIDIVFILVCIIEISICLFSGNLERKPTYVVISACASYLGDYFTGGVGSLLYVDEFEFVYD